MLKREQYGNCVILHVDADSFFASVEQALKPELRGQPVVTGAERGIIAAASQEAKLLGIKRGLQLHEARRLCPSLVVLPSDYEAYSLYSRRMFEILRRFTPFVEEYSIDEAFADLSGCEQTLGLSLEDVAARLRKYARHELGLTVSVGISLTKTLSKLCSKFRKPDGQTILRAEHLPKMLQLTPVDKVWGIGSSRAAKLHKAGVSTAWDFSRLDGARVLKLLHKPGYDTWCELQGKRTFELDPEPKEQYVSMMKGHTFAPPGSDAGIILAEAFKNTTEVMAKLRRHSHVTREIGLYLRFKGYDGTGAAIQLPRRTSGTAEAIAAVRTLFERLFDPRHTYRSTMVWLGKLEPLQGMQMDMFEETEQRHQLVRLDEALDSINARYGQGSVVPAAMLELARKPAHVRDAKPERYKTLMQGETNRHLALPRITLPDRAFS